MTPKEIGRNAGRIFNALLPNNWAVRSQETQEDYGIDYEIELTTAEDKATGLIFKVQQKGMLSADTIAGGKTISFNGMEVEKVHYYLQRMAIPVVFIVVDISTGLAFWITLQGNPEVETAYRDAIASAHDTLTLHLPACNSLAITTDRLLNEVARCLDWLTLQSIKRLSSTRLLDAASKDADFSHLTNTFGRHHDALRIEQLENLVAKGMYGDAWSISIKLFESTSETVEMRFTAGLYVQKLAILRTDQPNNTRFYEQLLNTRMEIAARLLTITRPSSAPRHLRVYARFLARTTRLRALAENDSAMYTSLTIQKHTGDDFTRHMTNAARATLAGQVIRELRNSQLAIVRLVATGHFAIVTEAWSQIVSDVMPFLLRLKTEGLYEAVSQLVGWFDRLGEVCVESAKQRDVPHEVILCSLTQIGLSLSNELGKCEERIRRARENIESIRDLSARQSGLQSLDEFASSLWRTRPEITIEQEIEVIRSMAKAYAINLEDETDGISRIVNIGIRDLNPERILKNCQHLFVSIGNFGIPAQMLGLPTAGSKWIHCVKFGHSVGGQSLDNAYKRVFYESYCKDCKDCLPHSADWRWSRKWQEGENAKHSELAKRVSSS